MKNKILSAIVILFGIIFFISPLSTYVMNYVRGLTSAKVESRGGYELNNETYKWKLNDGDGNVLHFEQFKGNVIVLNFWATWCGPCIEEMPSFQSLYNTYGKEVSFLFLAEDDQKRVENLFRKKRFNLPVFYSKGSIPDQFFSRSYPTTFIINKKGTIELANIKSMDWNKKEVHDLLDRLLTE